MRHMLKDVTNNKCREKRKIIKSSFFMLNEKIFIATVRRRGRYGEEKGPVRRCKTSREKKCEV